MKAELKNYLNMTKILFISLCFLTSCFAYTVKSKIFYAPKNCSYHSAYIQIENLPSEIRGSDMGPRFIERRSFHSLVISGINTQFIYPIGISTTSSSDYQIHFSQDCTNLSVSENKKDFWVVSLETSPPLFCKHSQFNNEKTFPSTKKLILEILKSSYSSTKSSGHAKLAIHASHYSEFKEELEIAIRYATLHSDDPDFRQALSDFISQPGLQLQIYDDFILKEYPSLMKKFPDFLEKIQSATKQPESELAWKLLSAFLQNEDPENTLSKILSMKISLENCTQIHNLTKSIAYRIAKSNKWFPTTMNLMKQVIENPICPLKEKPEHYSEYKEVWSIKGETARVIALRVLTMIQTKESKNLLEKLAKPPCGGSKRENEKRIPTDGPLPLFTSKKDFSPEVVDFVRIDTHTLNDISCWAKSYLNCCK